MWQQFITWIVNGCYLKHSLTATNWGGSQDVVARFQETIYGQKCQTFGSQQFCWHIIPESESSFGGCWGTASQQDPVIATKVLYFHIIASSVIVMRRQNGIYLLTTRILF